jgi:hypothetical protein
MISNVFYDSGLGKKIYDPDLQLGLVLGRYPPMTQLRLWIPFITAELHLYVQETIFILPLVDPR